MSVDRAVHRSVVHMVSMRACFLTVDSSVIDVTFDSIHWLIEVRSAAPRRQEAPGLSGPGARPHARLRDRNASSVCGGPKIEIVL